MSIDRICNDLQKQVESFKEVVSTTKSVPKDHMQTFMTAMNEKTATLQAHVRSNYHVTAKAEQHAVQKLTQAVAALGNMPQIAAQLGKPGVNVGNVLLSLSGTLEELRKKPKERELPKKLGIKVEKYEVAQFLDATEKELEHFVTVIKMEEADEDVLYGIIIELLRRMEMIKMIHQNLSEHKVSLKVDPVFYKRILGVLKEFEKDTLRHRIYAIGVEGESKNMHLRLFKMIKAFQNLISSFVKS